MTAMMDIEMVEMGTIVKHDGGYWMVGRGEGNGEYPLMGRKGETRTIFAPFDVDITVPWYEQVDGYKVMFERFAQVAQSREDLQITYDNCKDGNPMPPMLTTRESDGSQRRRLALITQLSSILCSEASDATIIEVIHAIAKETSDDRF